jgi:hypothetical protein
VSLFVRIGGQLWDVRAVDKALNTVVLQTVSEPRFVRSNPLFDRLVYFLGPFAGIFRSEWSTFPDVPLKYFGSYVSVGVHYWFGFVFFTHRSHPWKCNTLEKEKQRGGPPKFGFRGLP